MHYLNHKHNIDHLLFTTVTLTVELNPSISSLNVKEIRTL